MCTHSINDWENNETKGLQSIFMLDFREVYTSYYTFRCVESMSIFTGCAVKVQAILHKKKSNKRFIMQHAKMLSVRANFADIYLEGMSDKYAKCGKSS